MVERRTANGRREVCKLTGLACPKAAKKWLGILGLRGWIIDIDLYHERVRKYNRGIIRKRKPQKAS